MTKTKEERRERELELKRSRDFLGVNDINCPGSMEIEFFGNRIKV